MTNRSELTEIAHCGGIITLTISISENGGVGFFSSFRQDRPVAMAVYGIYALPPHGIPTGLYNLFNPEQPEVQGSLPVLIASDSQGLFGRQCPKCANYWRSRTFPSCCAYCLHKAPSYEFITDAQHRYTSQYVQILSSYIQRVQETKEELIIRINMDDVADAVGLENKPEFYYSEVSQQNDFRCVACKEHLDVLGRFCYCSLCQTSNAKNEFDKEAALIRATINRDGQYTQALKNSVSLFDAVASHYISELLDKVPLIQSRYNQLKNLGLHSIEQVQKRLDEYFGIDIFLKLSEDDKNFLNLMFLRRHVYEHCGGQADQEYLDKSGDIISLRQSLRESQESTNRLLTCLAQVIKNLHLGFHDLIPVNLNAIRVGAD